MTGVANTCDVQCTLLVPASFLLDGSADLRVAHVRIVHMIGLSNLVFEGFNAWLYIIPHEHGIC